MSKKTPESISIVEEKIGMYHDTTANLNSPEKLLGVPNPKQSKSESSEHGNDEQILATSTTANNEGKIASQISSQFSSISLQSLPDEGYISRQHSRVSLRSNFSTSSLDNCTNSLPSIPLSEVEEVDEGPDSPHFEATKLSDVGNHEDELASITENLHSINLADCINSDSNSQKQGRNILSHTRRGSYQPSHPPASICVRRHSETAVSYKRIPNIRVRPFRKLSLPSQAGPTCIMCRRNSQQLSPPTKRKISLTRGYIFKALPIRRWNSEIFTALHDEDDPDSPFHKVRFTISKMRRMSKSVSAKDVLKAISTEEDLTEEELWSIAEHVEPVLLPRLATKLSFDTPDFLRMEEKYRSEPLRFTFMVLWRWRESKPESHRNRKELTGIFCDLDKVRLAEMVAVNNYRK